ncbi:MAG: transposase [Sporolactobacillus sp.]
MDGYQKGDHSVYNIRYHMIWVTKYRYQVLRGQVAAFSGSVKNQSSCLFK